MADTIFSKLKNGIANTAKSFNEKIDQLIYYSELDDDFFDDLEETLILSDLGVETATKVTEALRAKIKDRGIIEKEKVLEALYNILYDLVNIPDTLLKIPVIIIVVGVNGVGKTTTIAKLAKKFNDVGLKTMIVAADTFRAAATEQLETWANRVDVPIIKAREGADPSSVVFDGIHAAKHRGTEVLIIDTAGRLHNKVNLMNELNKIGRVVEREGPDFSKHNLLVVDATTGQNAITQAEIFNDAITLDGVAMTKLDGTSKGGIAIAIIDKLGVPIEYVGVGEGVDDLIDFNPRDFVNIIAGFDQEA